MIQIEALNHTFGSGEQRHQVLFDVSATIAGEVVMLEGPSGSGKSTLLTLLGGLRSVQEGSLRVLGHELAGADAAELVRVRRGIGFIFQQHNLLDSLTALHNVESAAALAGTLSTRERRSRATAMLDRVGLAPYLHRYPAEMSGGQRQRVAIARALVNQPRLILADEPTASLDGASGREVVRLIREMVGERRSTALIVTHDERILPLAERTLRIEDGRLFPSPPPESSHGAA